MFEELIEQIENDLSKKENGEILFPNHNYIKMNNS